MSDLDYVSTSPIILDAHDSSPRLRRLLMAALAVALRDAVGGVDREATMESRRWLFFGDDLPPGPGEGAPFLWLHSAIISLGGSLPSVDRIRAHVVRRARAQQRSAA